MSEIIYKCPECSGTNLIFDVSGAIYDPIYKRFTAYVNQEKKASCIDCKSMQFEAVKTVCKDESGPD